MAKPRIIIADTDVNYITPLQLKFVEDFFEKIDLEIITDEVYFNELFASPQKADILIISEELYSQSIQRHNIGNIFLMTEQNEEEQTADLNVNFIFKYTSIKEIFNEIIGKSAGVLSVDVGNKKETQVILVYSACGGVGKTTVAMGISACLTKSYKRVLYINAGHLQAFQRLLDNETPITSNEIYAKLASANVEKIYNEIKHVIRKELFCYIPPFKASLMSLGLKYSVYEKLIFSAKKSEEYDYIVVDADITFDEDKAKLIGISDKVIVVTEQTASAVYATNVLVSNVTGMDGEKYIFVCNNFEKDGDNALISPKVTLKFSVSDYIEHFYNYDDLKCEDISKDAGIRKIAFLIV